MDRYVEAINLTKDIKDKNLELTEIHPEESGNYKINTSIANGFKDINIIDSSIKDLGNKVEELLNRKVDRLETVLTTINSEKERLQDISMLCNLKTDYENVIPLTNSDFTGDYSYIDGVFYAKTQVFLHVFIGKRTLCRKKYYFCPCKKL